MSRPTFQRRRSGLWLPHESRRHAFATTTGPGGMTSNVTGSGSWRDQESQSNSPTWCNYDQAIQAFIAEAIASNNLGSNPNQWGWWKCNDSAAPLADSSGNTNNATATGSFTFGQPSPFLIPAGETSVKSAAASSYFTTAYPLATTGPFTLLGWFNVPSFTAQANLFGGTTALAAATGLVISATTSKGLVVQFSSTYQISSPANALTAGKWFMGGITWDTRNLQLYLNGEALGPLAVTAALSAGNLTIGTANAETNIVPSGTGIAEVFVMENVLTPTQMQTLYDIGAVVGGLYLPASAQLTQ